MGDAGRLRSEHEHAAKFDAAYARQRVVEERVSVPLEHGGVRIGDAGRRDETAADQSAGAIVLNPVTARARINAP